MEAATQSNAGPQLVQPPSFGGPSKYEFSEEWGRDAGNLLGQDKNAFVGDNVAYESMNKARNAGEAARVAVSLSFDASDIGVRTWGDEDKKEYYFALKNGRRKNVGRKPAATNEEELQPAS